MAVTEQAYKQALVLAACAAESLLTSVEVIGGWVKGRTREGLIVELELVANDAIVASVAGYEATARPGDLASELDEAAAGRVNRLQRTMAAAVCQATSKAVQAAQTKLAWLESLTAQCVGLVAQSAPIGERRAGSLKADTLAALHAMLEDWQKNRGEHEQV
jgi:hypothetical protein